ncbi:MAG: S24/S26 family peptidase [Nanoarchaeota archaeon]
MEKRYLIYLILGILLVSGCRVNSSNENIPICSFQATRSLNSYFYYDTKSMNIINGTKLYYNLTKEPEIGDVVIVDDSKYKQIEGNRVWGFTHRVWLKPADQFYITKGDNNQFVDGAYPREKIKGVIICKNE